MAFARRAWTAIAVAIRGLAWAGGLAATEASKRPLPGHLG